MLRSCLGSNTGNKMIKTLAWGVMGFFMSDGVSMYCSQKIWWPITAKVYAETLKGKKVPIIKSPDSKQAEKVYTTEELLQFKNEKESLSKKFQRVYAHQTNS